MTTATLTAPAPTSFLSEISTHQGADNANDGVGEGSTVNNRNNANEDNNTGSSWGAIDHFARQIVETRQRRHLGRLTASMIRELGNKLIERKGIVPYQAPPYTEGERPHTYRLLGFYVIDHENVGMTISGGRAGKTPVRVPVPLDRFQQFSTSRVSSACS
jgi:hypothetical protein